jgi:heme exporter protein A
LEASPTGINAGESPALELDSLRRDYGERTALRGVSLKLERGQSLAVVGPNGAGKTTLLRVLAGLLRPTDGRVRVLGCDLPKETWRLRGHVGWLGHEPLLYRDLSPRENLRFSARLHGLDRDASEARIGTLLDQVGLGRRGDDRVRDFSAGMLQRAAVARAVLHEPALLLLDEPLSHLDSDARKEIAPLIAAGERRSRVLVTHDDSEATGADHILRLGHNGAPA